MRHIRLCDTTDFRELTLLWERSVRATHSFLSEEDIAAIRANLPTYFANVVLYAITAVSYTHLTLPTKLEV